MGSIGKKITMLFLTSGLLAVLFGGILVFSYYVDAVDDTKTDARERSIDKGLVKNDVPYCQSSDPAQTLDAYLIEKPVTTPVVIYIHGGGWNQGDKENTITKAYSPDFINHDIAFISVDYRLSEEAVYPAQNQDVACAVDFILAQSEAWNINRENVMIMGDSAGGQLASMEALDRKHLYDAAIIAYGVTNVWEQISQYHDTNAIAYLGGQSKQTAVEASPQSADLSRAPTFLLIHGTADSVVPASESKDFAHDLKAAGSIGLYTPIQGAPHAFLGAKNAFDKQANDAIFRFIEVKW